MGAYSQLLNTINIEKWQVLQDALADVTGLAILTSDYQGVPVSRHSGCQPFCQKVRSDAVLRQHCQKCDSRGGLEAMRLKKPYIYRCHFDILDAAIPIIVDGAYLGAVLIGQARLTEQGDMQRLELVHALSDFSTQGQEEWEQYENYYRLLPEISLERLQVITKMLFHLCSYFMGEVVEKNAILRMIAESAQPSLKRAKPQDARIPTSRLASIKSGINNLIADASTDDAAAWEEPYCHNKVLQPAFAFVYSHKAERHSLGDMAALCHISPSYFSKLFKSVTGETWSAFMIRKRIEWGKSLLLSTDMLVSEIALSVGFNDASHFIRCFKKQEGITPELFRRMVPTMRMGT